jgi:hypothetical protein
LGAAFVLAEPRSSNSPEAVTDTKIDEKSDTLTVPLLTNAKTPTEVEIFLDIA